MGVRSGLRAGLCLAGVFAVAGCASIVEGTSQQIAVNTNPDGADCGLYRKGERIAEVSNTPGSVLIKKTKDDITVVCLKDGFEQTTYQDHSGIEGATFGNIVLGGGIGWAIDSASGADNKYDSPVNMSMVPVLAAAPAAAPTVHPAVKLPATWPQQKPSS